MSLVAENLGVDWSVFVDSEQDIIKKAIDRGHHEHLAALIDQLSPVKIIEIQKIQNQLRPKDFQFESQAQKEFEAWADKNNNLLTPAILDEWQAKIDTEKAKKLNDLTGGMTIEVKGDNVDGTSVVGGQVSNNLNDVKGLGELSITKLRENGVNTVEDFKNMPFEKKREVLGAVVAANFKDLI